MPPVIAPVSSATVKTVRWTPSYRRRTLVLAESFSAMILLQCHLDPRAIHTPFYDLLDTFGPWLHVAPTTWFISSNARPNSLATALHQLFREASFAIRSFSISELDKPHLAEFPQAIRGWLATQRRREFRGDAPHVLHPACCACVSLNCEHCPHHASLHDSPH